MRTHAGNIVRQASAIFALLLIGLAACSGNTDDLPEPPITVPFAVQKAGSKLSMEIWIPKEAGYFFTLEFTHTEGSVEDSDRVRKLAGWPTRDENGNWNVEHRGVPTPLSVKLYSGPELLHEIKVAELMREAAGREYFSKRIFVARLKPGRYRVIVESLKDVPELAGIPVRFSIGRRKL